MNAILHDLGQLVESVYLPLLALNAVALIVVYTVAYAGWHRGAKGIVQVVLCANTPVVLFILGAIVREAIAAGRRQGPERGMAVGMLVGFTWPLFLEYLLLLHGWWRVRTRAHLPPPAEKG